MEPKVDDTPDERRGALRAVSAVTLVVMLVATAGAAWATRQVVRDQEHRLLKERTSEIGLLLNVATATVVSNLTSAGTAAKFTNGSQEQWVEATKLDVAATRGLQAEALLAPAPDAPGTFVVQAVAGPEFKVGYTVNGVRAAALTQALTVGGKAVATKVLAAPAGKSIGIAVGPPAAPPGKVLYRETTVAAPGQSQTARAAPFSELNVVLYAAKTPNRAQAILTATNIKIPLEGDVVNQPFNLGVTPWLLSASAKHPLVGSLATRTPWMVLAGGILGALLLSFVIEVVLRRRDYALALVDDRTAALRESLSALESAQEQLVRQERLAAVGQLASAVGHELRNPLGVISNSLYLIRGATEASGDERLRRHVSTAERELAAATLIISDLLDFARAREPIITSVDLSGLLDEALEVAPPPDGVTVSRADGPGVPPVAADRDQLRQVLLNLITNGYDAMPSGGVLRVGSTTEDGRVSVTIGDSGTGVDEAVRSHLFEPFFTTKARGVGLGLAVTHRIVGAHGGTIDVASRPGEGATFTVSLPAFREAMVGA